MIEESSISGKCVQERRLYYKGCSSKSIIQGLHAHRRKSSYLRVRRLDGTQSLSELDQEFFDHFHRMFAPPATPTQSIIDAREVLLT